MGGLLPELREGYDITTVQDPYAEDENTSSTRPVNPHGLRTNLWPFWKDFLMDRKVNEQMGMKNVKEDDFWPEGLSWAHLEEYKQR